MGSRVRLLETHHLNVAETPLRDHWAKDLCRVAVAHAALILPLQRAVGDLREEKILEVGAGMGGDNIAHWPKQADAAVLPGPTTPDAVFHHDLLEHFQTMEQARLMKENWRMRDPRGILVVDVTVDRPERLL